MIKRSLIGLFLSVIFLQSTNAQEVSGFSISGKEYAELAGEIAKCSGYFKSIFERRYYEKHQPEIFPKMKGGFEIDEFSSEKQFKDADLLINIAENLMVQAEQSLSQTTKNDLQKKRSSRFFGEGFGMSAPFSILVPLLRDCVNKADSIKNTFKRRLKLFSVNGTILVLK